MMVLCPKFGSQHDGLDPFIGNKSKFAKLEEEMAKQRAKGENKMKGMSARKSALNADQEAWENNR